MQDELHLAYAIVEQVSPGKRPEGACMLVAAAIAGLRDMNMRDIKIGALFWPEHFEAEGEWDLAICGGWGVYCHSPSDGTLILHEQDLDDDGGFRGHTWIEHPGSGKVIDLMHGVDGGQPTIYRDLKVVGMWHRRPKLERLVKNYWRMEMREAMKAGRLYTKRRAKQEIAEARRKRALQMEEAL